MPVISGGSSSKNEWEFFRDLQKDGNIISLISSDFTGNGDQITYTVPNGKTFYLVKAKLYPVSNVIAISALEPDGSESRGTTVSLTFDGVTKDILTYTFLHHGNSSNLYNTKHGQFGTGQFETNSFVSLVGDGVKQIKLTSSSTSGTYRVSLFGWIE